MQSCLFQEWRIEGGEKMHSRILHQISLCILLNELMIPFRIYFHRCIKWNEWNPFARYYKRFSGYKSLILIWLFCIEITKMMEIDFSLFHLFVWSLASLCSILYPFKLLSIAHIVWNSYLFDGHIQTIEWQAKSKKLCVWSQFNLMTIIIHMRI